MARRVEDLWLALRVIAGPDGQDASYVPMPLGDPWTVEISAVRVAFHTAFPDGLPNEEAVSVVESAAAAFEREGARVVEAVPPRLEESLTITQAYWARPESMDLEDWRPYGASKLTADEVERSLFEWDRFRRSMLGFMADYDVVLSPAAEGGAPLADAPVTGETYRYTLPYSLTGQPVALVRAGTSAEGLPLGVQIAAGNWRDHLAVAGARFLEVAAGPWDMPLREP
jgi:amidase